MRNPNINTRNNPLSEVQLRSNSFTRTTRVTNDSSDTVKFNFEELNQTFQDEGANALLTKLKELKTAGAVTSISVSSDLEHKKTLITCEADGITYTFISAQGDTVDEPQQAAGSTQSSGTDLGEDGRTTKRTLISDVLADIKKANGLTDDEAKDLLEWIYNEAATNPDLLDCNFKEYEAAIKTLAENHAKELLEARNKQETPETKNAAEQAAANGVDEAEDEAVATDKEKDSIKQNLVDSLKKSNELTEDEAKDLLEWLYNEDTVNPDLSDCNVKEYEAAIKTLAENHVKELLDARNKQETPETKNAAAQAATNGVAEAEDSILVTVEEKEEVIDELLKSLQNDKGWTDTDIETIRKQIGKLSGEITAASIKAAIEKAANTLQTAKTADKTLGALNSNNHDIRKIISEIKQIYQSNQNSSKAHSVNTQYSIDNEGNLKFEEGSYTQIMYDDLFSKIKLFAGAESFDEATLKKLYNTAWKMTYSTYPANKKNDITDFLNKVFENLKNILNEIKTNPDMFDIYMDKTANGTSGAYNAVEIQGTETITCDIPMVYSDGSLHVSDNKSDAALQKAVKQMTEALKKAYPKVAPSTIERMALDSVWYALQEIADKKTDNLPANIKTNGKKISVQDLVKFALTYFERNLYKQGAESLVGVQNVRRFINDILPGAKSMVSTDEIKANEQEDEKAKTEEKEKYATAAAQLEHIFSKENTIANDINGIVGGNDNKKVKMNMTVTANRELSFKSDDLKNAYDKFLGILKEKDEYKNIGLTDDEFKNIYDAAWISVYNSYTQGSKQTLKDVLKKVIENIQKIVNKLKDTPEDLGIIQNKSAMTYAEKSDKTSLKHNPAKDASGRYLDYGDNNVHLSNDLSDKKYQEAIDKLKSKLKYEYVPPLSEDNFNKWFYQAQQDAINDCMNDSKGDIPFGTNYNDNKNTIWVFELMNIIAYKFDKLVYKNTFGV